MPGIGCYTAGAICSIAFNQPVPILDGNVIRVLTRLFAIEENPKDKETNTRLWHLPKGWSNRPPHLCPKPKLSAVALAKAEAQSLKPLS